MLVPNLFYDNFTDDFFNSVFDAPASKVSRGSSLMHTDIRENGTQYELLIELPGYKKEELQAELKDGYLTVSAEHKAKAEEKDSVKYLRRERYSGRCSRTFYVGDNLTENDIHAKFEDGILTLSLPKEEAMKKVEEKKFISIN